MNKPTITSLVLLLGCALPHLLQAQISGQIGEFEHLPQRVWANPALRPSGKVNVGIPTLSGLYFEQSNNWIKPGDYLNTDVNGVGSIDYKALLANMDNDAFTGFGSAIELFHLGMGFDDHYFHFRVAERVQGGVALPRDLFALAIYGNVGDNGFEDHTADLGGLRIDAMHYREYAIGYNRKWEEKFSVGLTAKYLYGMETIRTGESSLQLRTDPSSYEMRSSGQLHINTARLGVGEDEEDIRADAREYLLGLSNHGVGVDIGAAYHPIKKLRLEFSANDFGFISWKQDVANFGTTDADFVFDGINFTDFIFLNGSEFDDALQDEVDRIANAAEETFNVDGTHESFRSSLFGYFRYAASYELYDSKKTGGRAWANVMHAVGHQNLPARFSVGYNQRLWRAFQVGLHYSKQAGDGGFIGGGLSMNAGPVQLYAMVENAHVAQLSRYTVRDENDPGKVSTFILPRNPADLRVQVGLNLTFGRPGGKPKRSRPLKD